jgi:hypothetical protein
MPDTPATGRLGSFEKQKGEIASLARSTCHSKSFLTVLMWNPHNIDNLNKLWNAKRS